MRLHFDFHIEQLGEFDRTFATLLSETSASTSRVVMSAIVTTLTGSFEACLTTASGGSTRSYARIADVVTTADPIRRWPA